MLQNEPIQKLRLRHFSLPVRLCIAAFLISLGLGYIAALVQMHFQHASKGVPMPTIADVVARFAGKTLGGFTPEEPKSKMLMLVEADEREKFNASGQMSVAFFRKSEGWRDFVKKHGEERAHELREGEQKVVAAWLRGGAKREPYETDRFPASRWCHRTDRGLFAGR